jgi:hypothetical protein
VRRGCADHTRRCGPRARSEMRMTPEFKDRDEVREPEQRREFAANVDAALTARRV